MSGIAVTLSMLDRKLLRGLWQIKGQAVAIMLVIASGISLLVMSSGMLISLDETMRAYYERNRFADIFAPVTRAPRSLVGAIRDLPGVADVDGRISGGGLIDLPELSTPLSARIVSVDSGAATAINGVWLASGQELRALHPDEILLLKPFADAHGLAPGDSLSVTMNGSRHEFRIAGLALSPDGGIAHDDYPAIRRWLYAVRALPGFLEMPGIHALHDLRDDRPGTVTHAAE